ncbi:MAG: hypothetical protein ACRDV1_16225, partial [Actinomycetes bacterium]
MFERSPTAAEAPDAADAAGGVLTTASLTGLLGALDRPDRTAGDDQRIDQIRLLEQIKAAAAATQAVLTADFATSQRARQRAAGVPA